jgi:hypothetical protein
MAPNLAPSQHDLIRDMILHQKLTTREMADAAGCSERSIKAIRSNLRYFGSTKAPPNGGGGCRSITLQMLEVLKEHLLERAIPRGDGSLLMGRIRRPRIDI